MRRVHNGREKRSDTGTSAKAHEGWGEDAEEARGEQEGAGRDLQRQDVEGGGEMSSQPQPRKASRRRLNELREAILESLEELRREVARWTKEQRGRGNG